MTRAPAMLLLVLSACVAQTEPEPSLPVPLTDPGPAILAYVDGGTTCTAVAVTPRAALTAAHCLHASDPYVRAEGIVYPVLTATKRPGEDVADLVLGDSVPRWLTLASKPVHKGDLLQIWGYGCGTDDEYRPPESRPAIALSDHEAEARTCHGDSGGAVIGNDGVAGIVWGVSATRTGFTPL